MADDTNIELLIESKSSMEECHILLKEISTSCCMPERSPNMSDAFTQLNHILSALNLAQSRPFTQGGKEHIENSITQIGEFGRMTGYLYATCCTVIRAALYQKMFKEMNSTHGKLWACLGHSH